MAPSNGTLRLHPAMAPRPLHPALAPWCHVQSAKVVRRPPPLLEVRTPIAIAIWGKKGWSHAYRITVHSLTYGTSENSPSLPVTQRSWEDVKSSCWNHPSGCQSDSCCPSPSAWKPNCCPSSLNATCQQKSSKLPKWCKNLDTNTRTLCEYQSFIHWSRCVSGGYS